MTTLSNHGVLLRPWRKEDEEPLALLANDRNVSIYLRDQFPFPYTKQDAINWIDIANQETPLKDFAIEVDGHIVGGIGMALGDDIHRCNAEVGYWVGQAYWGKGFATEALKLFVLHAFDSFPLSRLEAKVFDFNPASARVLEKAGFSLEYRARKSAIKDGKVVDELIFAMVR